jgi:hypothetical protein
MKLAFGLFVIALVGMGIGELMLRSCIHPFPAGQEPTYCTKWCH